MNKVLFKTKSYAPIAENLTREGFYYLRSIIRTEADGLLTLASEKNLDHYPTEEEVAASDAEAAAEAIVISRQEAEATIANGKASLSNGDYKVTKTYEWIVSYYLTNGAWPTKDTEGWPYPDFEAFHNEREALRGAINTAEEHL